MVATGRETGSVRVEAVAEAVMAAGLTVLSFIFGLAVGVGYGVAERSGRDCEKF